VNMLAREIGPKIGFWKPVVVSHHMILGLTKPATKSRDPADMLLDMKMSKSRPDSAIFMDDSEQEVNRKIAKAYCPGKQVEMNPILEYCKYMIFERFKTVEIGRPAKFGGSLSVSSYDELVRIYRSGELHPADLKSATASYINELIKPVRMHFKKNAKAKSLLERVKSYKVTR